MASRQRLLGLDLGGGSVRAVLVDPDGGDVVTAAREWSFPRAPDGVLFGFEMDLPRMWQCVGAATRDVLGRAAAAPGDVAGVAVSALRFATVLANSAGEVHFAVPNRDARAAGQAFRLVAECGEELLQESGMWPLSIHTLARLLWVQEQGELPLAEDTVQLSLGDWLNHRLCGVLATDPSQAGCVGVFDLARAAWNWERTGALGLPRSAFGEVIASGQQLGGLTPAAAEHLGLNSGTPVSMGGADTPCALLGVGAIEPGQCGVIAGTTAPIEMVLGQPRVDAAGESRAGFHVVPDRWVLESSAGTVGEVLSYFAKILFPEGEGAEERLLAEASLETMGAGGGVSTLGVEVMNDRLARLPVGQLTLSPMAAVADGEGRRQLARSVVEGIACGVRANLERLAAISGERPENVKFAGGLSRSEFLGQLIADVTGLHVERSPTPEASGLGAAVCAGVGAGVFDDFAAGVKSCVAKPKVLAPEAARHDEAERVYSSWDSVREAAAAEVAPLVANIATPAVMAGHSRRPVAGGAARRCRILVTADMDAAGIERLGEFGEVVHRSFREHLRMLSGDALVEELAGFDVFVTEVDLVDAAVIEACPDLRVVASCRGDAVNVDSAVCTAFGVPVIHAPGRNADAVADLTVAFILALARKLPEATRFLRDPGVAAGDMGKMGQAFMEFRGSELSGSTVGLVGFGAVGRAVARRLAGFRARVLVSDPFVDPREASLLSASVVELPSLLEQSDFVSLHAAVTPATQGLLGAAEFARMRPGAFLVNTARAALVDEAALRGALESGELAGAALDTFAVEPPGFDHPLVMHERVTSTPHVGGNTLEIASHQGRMIAASLDALLTGAGRAMLANPEALARFHWNEPRQAPSEAELAPLKAGSAPAVTDLARDSEN